MVGQKRIRGSRLVALPLLLTAIFGVYGARLVQIQIIDGNHYAALAQQYRTTTVTETASRGELLDRNGQPLAVNRAGFALVLDSVWFPRERQNEILASLIRLLSDAEEAWNDTFPLTTDDPPSFVQGREGGIAALKQRWKLPAAVDAAAVMTAAVERYGLQGYDAALQRRLAGVRYTMETAGFNAATPYTFAADVSRVTAAVVGENRDTYTGVTAQATPIREYRCGTVGAHLIGTVGPIYAEEYAARAAQGYRMTDTVGKSGLEAALEDTLRGTQGTRVLTWNNDGSLRQSQVTQQATAGDSVVLTLDSALQLSAQTAIEEQMAALRAQSDDEPCNGQDVRSGSAVLLDVHDGGVLVCASCPGYDLSTYREQYTALASDESSPLFNRALFGTFPCGSVIKPAVAVAGLENAVFTANRALITCDGTYHHYEEVGFAPKCMGRHGAVTLTQALRRSCNVYFYEAGRLLGIDRMNHTLSAFGLGQKTGIEIAEATGVLASPATKNGTWVAGDTCQCAIGQMDQRFTPLQLAAYAMTLANGGTRYRTHLVAYTRRYDGTVQQVYEPQVLAQVPMSASTAAAVRQGMCAVVKRGGTAHEAFEDAAYTLAAKTGTAQNSPTRSDHGVFIAYAPVEAPQVALAVVMENGTSAAASAVARQILDAWYEQEK
ncbi:MAG: hypothetical protein IKA63_01375 [Clostridia bacterium]|nr:hypothetical protein [Clostridia bacterium]